MSIVYLCIPRAYVLTSVNYTQSPAKSISIVQSSISAVLLFIPASSLSHIRQTFIPYSSYPLAAILTLFYVINILSPWIKPLAQPLFTPLNTDIRGCTIQKIVHDHNQLPISQSPSILLDPR